MKYLPVIARILLGLIYTASGVVVLFGLAPAPELEGVPATFMEGIESTGYFMPFLKLTETICGLLLLSGFGVPLALVVLAPVTLHIALYHLFVDPAGIVVAIVLLVLHAYLGYAYRGSYSGVLNLRARPG